MESLLNCQGEEFTAKIDGEKVFGKINVVNNNVYLCQNIKDGDQPDNCNTLEFKYCWRVNKGSESDLIYEFVTDFELVNDINIPNETPEDKLKQLFLDRSDCYADTGRFENDGSYDRGELIPAMTLEVFLETIKELNK